MKRASAGSGDDTALLVVDVQERLAAAMDPEALARVLGRLGALIEGARVLGLPIAVTEQYPKGLGHTVRAHQGATGRRPGRSRSSGSRRSTPTVRGAPGGPAATWWSPGWRRTSASTRACEISISEGRHPVLCIDAVLSRFPVDREAGLELARAAGATLSSVEAVLFELLARRRHAGVQAHLRRGEVSAALRAGGEAVDRGRARTSVRGGPFQTVSQTGAGNPRTASEGSSKASARVGATRMPAQPGPRHREACRAVIGRGPAS